MEVRAYLGPLILVGGLVASVAWVLSDARARAREGRPVAVHAGSFGIEQPEVWAAACLVLWVVFFPLYLRARSES